MKGLEFDYVVMVDVNASSFPADDESRHLFHIAATALRTSSGWLYLATATPPSHRSSFRGRGSSLASQRDRPGAAARHRILLFLEVAEDGARVDAEVARGLRAVAVVALEHLEHVAALELFFGLFERQDRLSRRSGPRSRSSAPSRVWSQSTSAFLMRFSSCRMLPGQAYFLIAASAGGLKPSHRALQLVGVLREERLRDDDHVVAALAERRAARG